MEQPTSSSLASVYSVYFPFFDKKINVTVALVRPLVINKTFCGRSCNQRHKSAVPALVTRSRGSWLTFSHFRVGLVCSFGLEQEGPGAVCGCACMHAPARLCV